MTPVLMMDGALVEAPLAGDTLRVTLTDPAAAEPWLTRLLGSDVAVNVLAGSTAVPRHPLLVRLALVLWARRWWPASRLLRIPPLPGHLLALEAAHLAAALDGHLDPFEATPQEWFDLAAAGPLDWSDTRPALEALATFFDEQDDERAATADRLAARATAVVPGDFALAAGGPSAAAPAAALASGSASVDWALVPPGVLDAAENTVRWSLIPAGSGAALRVEVAALSGAGAPVQAIATTAEHRLVIDLVPESLTLVGEAPVPDGVAAAILDGRLDVVVTSPGADSAATTVAERAAVLAWVQARADQPQEELLLAERSVAW